MDLQPMTPLPGVTTLQADITHPTTLPLLRHHLHNHPADLVLSDGAPDVTGLHDLDEYIQSQLLLSALSLASKVLVTGGTFVAKIFRGREVESLFVQLRAVFEHVTCAKPRSSRGSSIEAFVVCQGFRGFVVDGDWEAGLLSSENQSRQTQGQEEQSGRTSHLDPLSKRFIAPFVACGDLSSWDSDATYQLEEGRVSIDPVQSPTAPPYKTALEMRRTLGGETKGRERKEKEAAKDEQRRREKERVRVEKEREEQKKKEEEEEGKVEEETAKGRGI
ncbi:FtsJ-like methyltransferase-domain-containing protein [Peziza echinospora]|nr:FtsJ-like methyltransferase-domain-containing protein [Peziza echinospora]